MQTKSHDRISKVTIGGSDAWYMIGHAYFDRAFSEHFREIPWKPNTTCRKRATSSGRTSTSSTSTSST